MNQHSQNKDDADIAAKVLDELAGINVNKKGQRPVVLTELPDLLEETRLILLFDAVVGKPPLANKDVEQALTDELYDHIHPSRGGLSWDAYNKYARNCPPVAEAAARHRAFIEAKKRKA